MTSRSHARFVTNDLGSLLSVEQGGQILTQLAGADIDRTARCSRPKSAGRPKAEFLVYGDGSLTDAVSVGVVTASASLSTYVGGDAEGYGYRAGEGEIHHNGAAVETGLTVATDGDIITVEADLDSDPQTLTFRLNNAVLAVIDLGTSPGAGETWHLGGSLAGVNDGDLRLFLCSGQRAMQYDPARDAGWFTSGSAIQQLFLASDDYMSHSDDSPANQAFLPVLDPSGLEIVRETAFWPSGDQDPTGNIIRLPVIDPDGLFDDLVGEDVRDATIWIERLFEGEALSTAERIATVVLDDVVSAGAGRKELVCRDPLATLSRPLQRQYFLPNAEASANEPYPINLGAVRNFPPVLVAQADNRYRVNDAPVTSVADARDQGKLLDPEASPAEYILTTDREHIELLDPPAGQLTISVSSLGDAATEGQTDLLGGIGDSFADASPDDGLPDGFDKIGSNTGDDPSMYASTNFVGYPSEYFNHGWIADTSFTLEAGKTYKVEARFIDSPTGLTRPRFRVQLTDSGSNPTNPNLNRVDVQIHEDEAIEAVFTVPDDWPAGKFIPHFVVYANNAVGQFNVLEYLRVYELPDAFTATELPGLGLEQFITEVLEKRAGLPPGSWSHADAQAIDAATGYQVGWRTDQVVTQLDPLLAIADAWTISYVTDPDGVLRIVRLEDPDDTADVDLDWEASDYNLLATIEVTSDLAEGLTTAIACRRNWSPYAAADFGDHDFATVNQATRRALMRAYQETVTTGQDLPGMYAHAALAEPLPTVHDRPADAQAELDRDTALFAVPRNICVIELPEPPGTSYLCGQVGKLTEAEHGLSAGKKVQVLAERHRTYNERAVLVVWG